MVFSGFSHTGANCIFGRDTVNDEKEATYKWLFEQFFDAHKDLPSIVVSDHDLAVEAVMNKFYKPVKHLLCLWHITQSLSKYYNFLIAMNYQSLKDDILKLPYIEKPIKFDAAYQKIRDVLKKKNYNKGLQYLDSMYHIKEKWSRAYLPNIFTGGTRTTSRAESINALIKRYVPTKNDISDSFNLFQTLKKSLYLAM